MPAAGIITFWVGRDNLSGSNPRSLFFVSQGANARTSGGISTVSMAH